MSSGNGINKITEYVLRQLRAFTRRELSIVFSDLQTEMDARPWFVHAALLGAGCHRQTQTGLVHSMDASYNMPS
jgi:hypothetical protein